MPLVISSFKKPAKSCSANFMPLSTPDEACSNKLFNLSSSAPLFWAFLIAPPTKLSTFLAISSKSNSDDSVFFVSGAEKSGLRLSTSNVLFNEFVYIRTPKDVLELN